MHLGTTVSEALNSKLQRSCEILFLICTVTNLHFKITLTLKRQHLGYPRM